MIQLFAVILFFYFFGLSSIALTWYMVWSIVRYFKEQKDGKEAQ